MIGVISVTSKGDRIAEKLKSDINIMLFSKNQIEDFNLMKITEKLMKTCSGIIFISSTGIAVRAIAPYLKGKEKDPGVVVVDCNCNYAISLVSGHIGGANDLAIQVAKTLNIQPIITTATDGLNVIAPDVIAIKNNLVIEDLKKAKYISARLVDNNKVFFKDDMNKIKTAKGYEGTDIIKNNTVWITNKARDISFINEKTVLRLIRKDIVIGIGCRKNISSEKLIAFVFKTLEENNIDKRAVFKIGSVEIKKDERAINDLSCILKCPFETFSIEEIKKVEDKYEGSQFVLKTLGIKSVCQPSVELMGGKIIVSKIKYEGITLAIGQI